MFWRRSSSECSPASISPFVWGGEGCDAERDLGLFLGFRDWWLASVPGIEVVEGCSESIDGDGASLRRSGLRVWVAGLDAIVEGA